MECWKVKLVRQTATRLLTRLSNACFNLTMKYKLYPLDNGKPLENANQGSNIQTKFYNDVTIS